MKEFAADPEARVHPQTVIEHFGTWNAAKRAAGLMPRRFATREELVDQLRRLGEELGRTPTAHDIKRATRNDAVDVALLAHVRVARRRRCAKPGSTSRWGRSGSSGRSTRGARCSRVSSAVCRSSATGRRRGGQTPSLLTEWQVYRLFESRRGAWATFQFLVRERLLEEGATVAADGAVG